MPDTRKSKLGIALVLYVSTLLAGCSDPESGTKPFVPPSPALAKQYQDAQIKSVQDNPNIPAGQKDRIIALYQGGGRAAALPAQSTTGSK